MKVPELYVHEIIAIIQMLDRHVDDIAKEASRIHRNIKIRRIFWRFGLAMHLRTTTMQMMAYTVEIKSARELKEKLLESTGVDEKGASVTLENVIRGMNK